MTPRREHHLLGLSDWVWIWAAGLALVCTAFEAVQGVLL
jgi:hypothetical protein